MAVLGDHGGVPVVSVEGSLVRRVLLAALLIVALVGMHHLVASGCALHADSHQVTQVADSAPDVAGTHHASTANLSVVAFDWVQAPEDSGTGSGTAAFIACVAILLLLALLIRPRSWLRHRSHHTGNRIETQPRVDRSVQAPDLQQLSISRT